MTLVAQGPGTALAAHESSSGALSAALPRGSPGTACGPSTAERPGRGGLLCAAEPTCAVPRSGSALLSPGRGAAPGGTGMVRAGGLARFPSAPKLTLGSPVLDQQRDR